MFRAALRSTPRAALRASPRALLRAAPRRLASTRASADRPRSWKSLVLRWGLAVGAVYYYSTSSVFADEAPAIIPAPAPFAESDLRTVDAVIAAKQQQAKARPEEDKPSKSAPAPQTETEDQSSEAQAPAAASGSPEALEEGGSQEGAFNPETGEINWDCPCLGGMAQGPCGEDFKSAFSCFVHSTEEPKGMDCIDKFQSMQECFRKYPEIYGAELADEEQSEQYEDGSEGEGANRSEDQAATDKIEANGGPGETGGSDGPGEARENDGPGEARGNDEAAPSEPPVSKTRPPQDDGASTLPLETDIQALREDVAVVEAATPSRSSAKSAKNDVPARWADATDANDGVAETDKPKAPAQPASDQAGR